MVNCGVKRWTIHAPCSDEYERDDEGNWVEWDDVVALLWERDEARTEADTLRAQLAAANALLTRAVRGDYGLAFRKAVRAHMRETDR